MAQKTSRKAQPEEDTGPASEVQLLALLGLPTSLSLMEGEEEIARLIASAASAALGLPLGIVILEELNDSPRVVAGQLDSRPLSRDAVETIVRGLKRAAPDDSLPAGPISSGENPELSSATRGIQRFLVVPLRAVDGDRGALVAGTRRELPFDAMQTAALEMLSAQTMAAVHHTRTLAERARLTSEAAQLQERARLARELHDTLGQSLAGIALQLENAEELLADSPDASRAAIQSARQLARSTLEEARRSVWDLQSSSLEAGDLRSALEREASTLRTEGISAALETSGRITGELDPRSEHALLRIVQEALNNVRKHANAETVTMRLECGPKEVRLSVVDDGLGFDPEEPTGVLSASGGFGLTSMQERARLVGGRVEVRSAPEVGTAVVVSLPLEPVESELPPGAAATANVEEKDRDRIRVLITDDHEVVRSGLRRMLDSIPDMEVVGEADSGDAALEEIARLAPDVVLLDLQMPGLDGVGTLRRLREEGSGVRVLLLSVFAKEEQVFEGIRAGARGYLVKDVTRDDLAQAIRTVHDGGSLIPPVVTDRLLEGLGPARSAALTQREREVLRELATGARNQEIAQKLSLSTGTVKWHVGNLLGKLGVTTRTEAVDTARKRGLLDD
jgi:signal transduction histidine kinase/DNA-binding NarL/FixJ family response regulator